MSYLSYFTPGNISNRTVPQLVSCKDVDKDLLIATQPNLGPGPACPHTPILVPHLHLTDLEMSFVSVDIFIMFSV